MPSISIRVGQDLPDGGVLARDSVIAFSRLESYVRDVGGVAWFISPDPVLAPTQGADGAASVVELSAGTYRVDERWGTGRNFATTVTVDAAYPDLPVLDPSTLGPVSAAPTVRAELDAFAVTLGEITAGQVQIVEDPPGSGLYLLA